MGGVVLGSGRCGLCLVGGWLCDVIVGWWDVGGGILVAGGGDYDTR